MKDSFRPETPSITPEWKAAVLSSGDALQVLGKNIMSDLMGAMTTCILSQEKFVRTSGTRNRRGVHLLRCSNVPEVEAMVGVQGRWKFIPLEQVPAENKPLVMAFASRTDWSRQGLMVLACDLPPIIAHHVLTFEP